MSVTPYYGNDEGPNILKASRRLGRLTALNEYMQLIQEDTRRSLEAQAAREAIAEEAAQEDTSEDGGFWSKLGDGSLNALDWTVDKLSRANYAVANAASELIEETKETVGEKADSIDSIGDFLNPFSYIPDDASDYGDIGKAAWEGLKGEDKTTFADVLTQVDEGDGEQNLPDWFKGTTGFVLDVGLDPTTYLGLNLVRRGLEAATPAAKAVLKESDDVTPSFVREDGAELSDDELSLIDDVAKLNLTRTDAAGDTILIDHSTVAAMLGARINTPGLPIRASTKTERARTVSQAIKLLDDTKRALDNHVDTDFPVDDIVKQIDDRITELKSNRVFSKDLVDDDYVRQSSKEILEAQRRTGELPEPSEDLLREVAKELSEEEVSLSRIQQMLGSRRQVNYLKSRLSDPSNQFKSQTAAKLKEAEAKLREAEGSWWESEFIDDAFRNTAIKDARDRLVQTDAKFRSIMGDDGLGRTNGKVVRLQKEIKGDYQRLRAEKNLEVRKLIEDEIRKKKFEVSRSLAEADRLMARGLAQPLSHHLADKLLAKDATYQRLSKEATLLGHRADELDVRVTGGGDIAERQTVLDELSDINNQLTEYRNNFINTNTSFFQTTKTLRRGNDGFDEALEARRRNEFQLQRDRIEQTFRRGKRESAKSQEIAKAANAQASAKASKGLSVEVGDTPLTRRSLNLTHFKKQYVPTETDKAVTKFFKDIKSLPALPSLEKAWQNFQRNFPDAGLSKADFENLWAKFVDSEGLSITPVAVGFERLFFKQNGIGTKAAKAGETGNNYKGGIEVVNFNGETISRAAYNQRRLDDLESASPKLNQPDDFIIIGGKKTSRQKFLATKGATNDEFNLKLKALLDTDSKFAKTIKTHWNRQWDSLFKKQSGNAAHGTGTKLRGKQTVLTKADQDEIERQASEIVKRRFPDDIETVDVPADTFERAIRVPVGKQANDYIEREIKRSADEHKALREAAKKNPDAAKRRQLLEEIDDLYKKRSQALSKARKDSRAAKKEMAKRLEEQMLLNLGRNTIARGEKTAIQINFLGQKVAQIPTGNLLTKSAEKLSTRKTIETASKAWRSAFTASKGMDPGMNLARLRMQSDTARLIKLHTDQLRDDFARFKPAERKAALNYFKRNGTVGTNSVLDKKMAEFFETYTDYVRGNVKVGDEVVTPQDIMRYLPPEFHLLKMPGEKFLTIRDGQDLVKHMRNLKPGTDPLKVMWRLSMAAEQAMAYKALQHTVRNLFGVPRSLDRPNPWIEGLIDRFHWRTSRDMGENFVFPPDVADDVDHLMNMLKPRQISEVGKVYDKAMLFWKSAVTVYNPGYYMRNGIGEVIMGSFDGVSNPSFYKRAANIIRYAMPDEVKESLKQIEPWKHHQSLAQKGAKPLVKLRNGRTLNAEEVWVLYNQAGLKSGFISSEYDHFVPSGFRSTGAGKVASKVNDKVREKGEKFEDYFRLAHFIKRLEQSRYSNPVKAAEDASHYVRKYHFDYTDFTPFEKSVMLRLFPFYKWQRKSLPLMASMLFMQPGKINIFPKAMQNLSYATGATDPTTDVNGFVPNYEDGMPEWLPAINAYPFLMQDDVATYANLSTPHFDAFKTFASPKDSAISMLSPAIKTPLELSSGTTLDGRFTVNDKSDYLSRLTPQSNLMKNLTEGYGSGDNLGETKANHRLISFLSGLGLIDVERTADEPR